MPGATKIIVRAGLIAGLYVVLSLLTLPIASGAIQFRLSEALTILPLFFISTAKTARADSRCVVVNRNSVFNKNALRKRFAFFQS